MKLKVAITIAALVLLPLAGCSSGDVQAEDTIIFELPG